MEILIQSGLLIVGLVLLYFGAEWLVKGSASAALRLGISPLVVGLTVVAFGTSAPELVASIKANLAEPKQGGLAIGNVLGSNVCNIALVLGLSAFLRPLAVDRQVGRRDLPILLAATAMTFAFVATGVIARWEGGVLFAGVVLYTVISLIISRRQGASAEDALEELTPEEIEELQKSGADGKALLKDAGFIVLGLVALTFGADLLVGAGVFIATAIGVPSAVIGLTMVALGTSLPELATSVAAVKGGHGDIVVGNVLGSCIFNLLAVVGATAIIAPITPEGVTTVDYVVCAAVTLLLAVGVWISGRVSRQMGLGYLVIYVAYIGWLASSVIS